MADFQASFRDFESEGIKIVAASVDALEKAKETVQKVGITYPVARGLDPEEVAGKTGAYFVLVSRPYSSCDQPFNCPPAILTESAISSLKSNRNLFVSGPGISLGMGAASS